MTTHQDTSTERERFEAEFPVPSGLTWNGIKYACHDEYLNSHSCNAYVAMWRAWQAALASRDEAAVSSKSADYWDGAEEWMPLAYALCADECGEEACHELVWEGGPIPEPWGDRYLKYEDEAKRLIKLVREHVPAAQQQQGQAVSDADVLTRAIQRLNVNPYSMTKQECITLLQELRDDILALRDKPDHFPDARKMMQLSDDFATIAGLESAVGHLSTLVDEQRALLVESEDVFGRDGHGGRYEDGECGLIDRIRAHLEMTAPPPNGITAKEQGNEN